MPTPHFHVPFQMVLTGGAIAAQVVEQDSSHEVTQCVRAILATRPGERDDFPDMGIEDPTFGELDLDEMRTEVEEYEPRAEILSDSEMEDMVQRVTVSVGVREDV